MPTVGTSHIVIDLPTLFAATVFLSANGSLLLLFSWLQNRETPALAFWGIGYMLGSAAAAVLASSGSIPNTWAVCIGNTLLCCCYGMMWGGARSFEGRRVHAPLIALGAVIWLIAFQFDGFYQSLHARVALVSLTIAFYSLLCAREVWYARDPELISRWPTLALILVHAGFLLARIPFADALSSSFAEGHLHNLVISAMAFETLLTTFCLPFLRVAMAKERAELEQRRAALTDALTGVANRRAFFDFGSRLLARTLADGRPAALLLFDLDRFKEVNDTAGHQAGDRVLEAFARLVSGSLRPSDLFGRLGGEEFACLLTGTSVAETLQVAERIRREFEAIRFPDMPGSATVSVGVAMASNTASDLPALLAIADRALYRAKADGRNRVAPAPLVVIGGNSSEAPRQPAEGERAPRSAPMTG